jgi:hypothetical protein
MGRGISEPAFLFGEIEYRLLDAGERGGGRARGLTPSAAQQVVPGTAQRA